MLGFLVSCHVALRGRHASEQIGGSEPPIQGKSHQSEYERSVAPRTRGPGESVALNRWWVAWPGGAGCREKRGSDVLLVKHRGPLKRGPWRG